MNRSPLSAGLVFAVVAAASFGVSGALVKPLLEGGWSPAAAVTVRALIGGLVLAPLAVHALRGRWGTVWLGRWRILGMAIIGVAGTQLFYFTAVQRIPVGTAILIEYMAPLLLVAVAWVMSRRRPAVVVLVGSGAAFAGLLLIVSPSGSGALDPLGIAAAVAAMVCCAGYFVIAARPSAGLPPVALASAGLLIAPVLLALAGLLGMVPFTASIDEVALLGRATPWWVPMLVVGVISGSGLRDEHHRGRDARLTARLVCRPPRGRGRGTLGVDAAGRESHDAAVTRWWADSCGHRLRAR